MYSYKAYSDHEKPSKSSFRIACLDQYTAEAMILNAPERGIGVDSAWRYKSDTRAPMTALVTVDVAGHLAPGLLPQSRTLYVIESLKSQISLGAVLLSANAKEETLFQFFVATIEQLLKVAELLTSKWHSNLYTRGQAEI